MRLSRFFVLLVLFGAVTTTFAQQPTRTKLAGAAGEVSAARSSAAYAEILLRKTELESVIESLLESYKEDFPKIKEARYELAMLEKDYEKILKQSDTAKLTIALGKLIVRKNELETNLWSLQNRFGKDHPEVARALRKTEIYRRAVGEILP